MSRLTRSGLSVDLPIGWEGSISGGGFKTLADGAKEPTVLHAASFPLPPERGTFGSGAVETMRPFDTLIVLVEYGPESANTPQFGTQGLPHPLQARQFDRNGLQRTISGQSGLQQFFSVGDRAFCLYVVLGSHLDRNDLVPIVNQVLATMEIQ